MIIEIKASEPTLLKLQSNGDASKSNKLEEEFMMIELQGDLQATDTTTGICLYVCVYVCMCIYSIQS